MADKLEVPDQQKCGKAHGHLPSFLGRAKECIPYELGTLTWGARHYEHRHQGMVAGSAAKHTVAAA